MGIFAISLRIGRDNCTLQASRRLMVIGLLSCLFLAGAGPLESARADMKLCNATSSRVGVAIGYRDQKGWATEGWWNVSSQTCEVLLRGSLPSRFIYVHAVDYDRGGEWAGKVFMCISDKSFWIRGVEDCQQRGHHRSGFFEVDTGNANEWTVRLTDPAGTGAASNETQAPR